MKFATLVKAKATSAILLAALNISPAALADPLDQTAQSSEHSICKGCDALSVLVNEVPDRVNPPARFSQCVDEQQKEGRGWNNSLIYDCMSVVLFEQNEVIQHMLDLMKSSMSGTYADDSESADEMIERLDATQSAWEQYRENQCTFESSAIGSPMIAFCDMRLHSDRLNRLRMLLEDDF